MNLQNSTTVRPTVYHLSQSRYITIVDSLRPSQYIVRAVLDGVYQVSTEVSLKGSIADLSCVIPSSIYVSRGIMEDSDE